MSTTIFILYLIYFILYEPGVGVYSFKKFVKRSTEHNKARRSYYLSFIIRLWIPTIALLLFVISGSPEITDIGLTLPVLNTGLLPVWTAYLIIAIATVLLLLTLYQITALTFSSSYCEKIRHIRISTDLDVLLPRTPTEKRLWTLVSISATICEELLYRGLLVFILTSLLPTINVYWCIVIAGLIFGITHLYQGISGLIKTTAYGILLTALYMSVGSILPGIILHFFIDFVSGKILPSTKNQQ